MLPFESVEDIRFEHKGGTSGPATGDSSEANSVQNYVILGASLIAGQSDASFIDAPVQSVTNASVNFFDNHADNGGSPPGGPDNLVLGDTNFTDLLLPTTELPFDFGDTGNFPAAIGVTSVKIDGTTAGDGVGANLPNKASTTINMFGAGSLEIGATNATNLNAQSSAHLIMDLPGVPDYVPFQGHGAWGIIVNGSLLGQNLLQGTSGKVEIELSANVGDETHGLTSGLGHNIAGHDLTFGLNDFGVYQAQLQSVGTGNPAGWGNDILTGGDGWGAVHAFNLGGSTFFSFEVGVANDGLIVENNGALERVLPDGADGPGNTGDNFFPEGGNDIVNISATEVGKLTNFEQICDSSGSVIFGESAPYDNQSTVWVGFYDVCNSAGPWAAVNALCDPNSGVGGVLNQAITDLWENNPTGEKFVDGYGGSPTGTTATLVTINGFHVGSGGDTIVFGAADWATGNIDDGDISFVRGLVEADGHTQISPNALGFAEFAPVTLGVDIDKNGSVILFDGGNSYSATSQVVSALLNTGIQLFDGGVDAHTTVDILIAYKTTGALGPGINIADLTLANFSGSSETDTTHFQGSGGVLQVHDLVHITTDGLLGLGTLDPHNIDFLV